MTSHQRIDEQELAVPDMGSDDGPEQTQTFEIQIVCPHCGQGFSPSTGRWERCRTDGTPRLNGTSALADTPLSLATASPARTSPVAPRPLVAHPSEHELQALRSRLALAERDLREIKGSTAWAVILVLWRVRTRLVPHGSLRDQLLWRTICQIRALRARGFWGLGGRVLPGARWHLHDDSALPAPDAIPIPSSPLPAVTSPVAAIIPPHPSPRRYDLVVFPIIDWDFRFQRPQQIATRFARDGHRVFYVRTSFDAGEEMRVRPLAEHIVEVQLPSSEPINIYGDQIKPAHEGLLLDAFERLRNELDIVDAVCLVDLPTWGPLALKLRDRFGWRVAYDCMDRHSGFSNTSRQILGEETPLTRESDLVMATSRQLQAEQAAVNPSCVLVPNGTDFDHFRFPPRVSPQELLRLPKPIVGYYGAIADWFDTDLVGKLARARPQWTFVLIGSTAGAELAPLRDVPNVHLLGEQPYTALPGYLYLFDACLIPFKKTPLTEATNPVKLFEYLSAGKAVVATDLEEIGHYRDHVRLASTPEQWLQAIEESLAPATPAEIEARLAFARQNTWDERVETVRRHVERLFPKVSIVVVTYNNVDCTRLCLESIYSKTTYPNFEVIVVDNKSTDSTVQYLREFESAHADLKVILNDTNEGFARGNNIGLAASSGEYVVFLNNDTVVTPMWLSSLVHHLQDQRVGLVGPVTNWAGNESRIEVDYDTLEGMELFADGYTRAHRGETFDIAVLALFCAAMRRSVLEEVGPLDERFGVGMFEDDDYAMRVRAKGYRVVCAEDAFVHHWGRASFSRLDTKVYERIFRENRRKFEQKWGQKWQPHKYRATT